MRELGSGIKQNQMPIERHYAYTHRRRFHYRTSGSGLPFVMLHDWFGSSFSLEPMIRDLAKQYAVFALDLPGYGESESLQIPFTTEQIANAIIDEIDALYIDRFNLYGTGAGAVIALAIADAHPGRIRCIKIEDFPDYMDNSFLNKVCEVARLLRPTIEGSHLVNAWSIIRNISIFKPWFRQDARHRLQIALPEADKLHDWTVDLLRGSANCSDLLRTISAYDHEGAFRRNSALIVQDLHGVGKDLPMAPYSPPNVQAVEGSIRRDYVCTSAGQLLMRKVTGGNSRTLVMFHAGPGSSAGLEPLCLSLASDRQVVTFDTPGNGDSSPLVGDPSIEELASVLVEGIDAAGIDKFDLYGVHTGAALAIEVALSRPKNTGHVILDGLPLFSEAEVKEYIANYAPEMKVKWDGSHLLFAWNFYRDMTLWFPWYKRDPEHARLLRSQEPDSLHEAFMEFLKGARTYDKGYLAAFKYDIRTRLALLRAPCLLCAHPQDILAGTIEEASRLLPAATVMNTPRNRGETSELFRQFLDELY